MTGLDARQHAEPGRPPPAARPVAEPVRPGPLSAALATRVAGLHGGGQPIPDGDREYFRPAMGALVDDVRLHTGPAAGATALALRAHAFTHGADIAFAPGRYVPGSPAGRELLAHELVHVAQAGGGGGGPVALAADDSASEREARTLGTALACDPGTASLADIGEADGVVQRAIIYDASGTPVSFEFRVGTELRAPFVLLAQRLAADGAISDDDLRQLRAHARDRRGTLDDNERMFMAGLAEPANVALLQAMRVRAGAAVTFTFASISAARMQHVVDLDREPMPASVAAPLAEAVGAALTLDVARVGERLTAAEAAAELEIVARGGPFAPQARAAVAYARANRVPLAAVLAAMLAAASDSTPGDRALAATVYAVAAAAGNTMAADLLAGRLKVDALIPRAYNRLAAGPRAVAAYVSAAQAGGMKGDTIYVRTTLDVTNLYDRSVVIHELRHAEEDRAGPRTGQPAFPAKRQMELRAYRAQARYILEQLAAQPADARSRAAAPAARGGNVLLACLVLETHADVARFRPALEAVFGRVPAPMRRTPAQVGTILAIPAATIETAALQDIDATYGLAAGATGVVEGLAGESLIHWVFRL